VLFASKIGQSRRTYGREVAECKHTKETGLSTGSITNDDQLPTRDTVSAYGLLGLCSTAPSTFV